MKSKRFLAMLLAAVMVMTAIFSTGCSKKENNEQSEKSGIVTLNMFIITDEATSEQSKLEVQWEINKITVPQHKTLVKLNYITGEEYWDIVDAECLDISKAANLVKTVPDSYITEDGTGVTSACIDYILPLVQGECNVKYVNGLPLHFAF